MVTVGILTPLRPLFCDDYGGQKTTARPTKIFDQQVVVGRTLLLSPPDKWVFFNRDSSPGCVFVFRKNEWETNGG